MRIHGLINSEAMHLAILRGAALVVPGPLRAEWLAEWRAELWYVRELRSAGAGEDVAAFCLGAFKDAFWLRAHSLRSQARQTLGLESPLACALVFAAAAAATLMAAFLLPGARTAILPSPYRDAGNLVMIAPTGHFAAEAPTIPLQQYRTLKSLAGSRFTGLAFYRPIRSLVTIDLRPPAEWSVALASSNLFELLNIRDSPPTPGLVLSRAAWLKYLAGDPHIIGRVLEVFGQPAKVVAVISEDAWRLPGRMDAWLLADEPRLAALPSNSKGFVLAKARTSASQAEDRWHLSVPNQDGGYDGFDCQSLAMRIRQPWETFLSTIFWACLVFPATTSLSLGEYPANPTSHPWARRLRQWIFLATKIALILPIVYFGSLDLAHLTTAWNPIAIQTLASAVGCLFLFRWVLIDQRRRCPVCLRLLTHPARIGEPSRNLLEWNGTELICDRGHGVLHVAESPVMSWFQTQRWLYLDPSWSGLFR